MNYLDVINLKNIKPLIHNIIPLLYRKVDYMNCNLCNMIPQKNKKIILEIFQPLENITINFDEENCNCAEGYIIPCSLFSI